MENNTQPDFENEGTDAAQAIATETMFGDLRDLVLELFKHRKKSWQEMTEADQRELVSMVESNVISAVKECVKIIATRGHKSVRALLEQVTIKDEIKAVLKCSKAHELRHDLMDSAGDEVFIVMPKASDLLGQKNPAKVENDQLELFSEGVDDGGI